MIEEFPNNGLVSLPRLLAFNPNPRQNKVREILKTFSDDAETIYAAGIVVLQTPEFPAKQSIVAHCFRELINILIRFEKEKSRFQKQEEDEHKKQIIDALKSVEFIKNGNYQGDINKVAGIVYKEMKPKVSERDKIKFRYINENPKIKFALEDSNTEDLIEIEENIDEIVTKVKKSKDRMMEYVHLNRKPCHRISEHDLMKEIDVIENYILQLEQLYIKQKEGLDIILSSQSLSKEELEFVLAKLSGNLKEYFFSKLENPEWFEPLNKHGLLYYYVTNENEQKILYWYAIPYLEKVASVIPDKVMSIISSIIEDIKNENDVHSRLTYNCCVILAPKMPDEQLIKVWRAFIEHLNFVIIDYEKLKEIFARLKKTDENLTVDIIKQLLSVPDRNTDYNYKKILEITKDLFGDDPLKLFEIFCKIYKNIIDKFPERTIYRSAIEYHEQDYRNQHQASYKIVSAIRDWALSVLNMDNKDSINKIFQMLSERKYPIFTRIILHLLRVGKNCDAKLLETYLTDYDLFSNSEYRHEYYHLAQNKFQELPQEAKDRIFQYIADGPKSDGHTKQEKIDNWRRRNLDPIHQFLPKDEKNKYKDLIFDKDGNYIPYSEHPDFWCWLSLCRNPYVSPLEDGKMETMTLQEIVDFFKNWKSDNDLFSPNVRGLAESLQKDVKTNPSKYIDNLEVFREVKEPVYIRHLLYGLSEIHDKNDSDLGKILEFGKWVVSQNQEIRECNGNFDVNSNWYDAKLALARLLSQQNITDMSNECFQSSFQLMQTLVLSPDERLESKSPQADLLNKACNSLHGVSLEGLLRYCIQLKNNDKSPDIVIPILDKVLAESSYLETWAVFGKILPWINNAIPEWVGNNLDKLLPNDNNNKFNALWMTYLNYAEIFTDMFDLLQNAYEYALQEKLYEKDNDQKRNPKIGQHLAIYYIYSKIELDSNIMKYLFDIPENAEIRQFFVNFIGQCIESAENISSEIIDRCVTLWDWLLSQIKDKESAYVEMLREFEMWYRCEKFDRKWAIEQLHKVVVDFDISIPILMIKELLRKDLPHYTEIVFDIVRKLSIKAIDYELDDNITEDIVTCVVRYIAESSNNEHLKYDNRTFISEFLFSRENNAELWCDRLDKYARV